ncbi:hypothetical protein [Nonomuraea guangzhouensis]|uniref:Uncharacterized protein n=1 Tax=Nonomuraea guangzhouensis TaxID=1291555 RepID=A0ABW4GXK3_9ACTN|nr:hypothetical protein [Nonomuraea guangzhouensis]
MAKSSNKKLSAKHAVPQHRDKQFISPRSVLPDAESSDKRISWRFRHVDHDGPWGFDKVDGPTLCWIMERLAQFESMTINELFNNGGYPGKDYDVEALPTPKSRERLIELGLSDMTKVWALRLEGEPRLYGFLYGNCFHVVWWDPLHQVWPSNKKRT